MPVCIQRALASGGKQPSGHAGRSETRRHSGKELLPETPPVPLRSPLPRGCLTPTSPPVPQGCPERPPGRGRGAAGAQRPSRGGGSARFQTARGPAQRGHPAALTPAPPILSSFPPPYSHQPFLRAVRRSVRSGRAAWAPAGPRRLRLPRGEGQRRGGTG